VRRAIVIFRRELAGYGATPATYVVIAAFLLAAAMLPFFAGDFAREPDNLDGFFRFHPWLYLGLVPALSIRSWAVETENGMIELLLTLPLRRAEAVIGKFCAVWCVAGSALALTFPLWLTVNLLGRPDNGVVLAGYGASWLMAGALLAIGEAVSVASGNRIVAFAATAAIVFALTVASNPAVLGVLRGWVPAMLVSAVAAAGITRHFIPLTQGILGLSDLFYFLSLGGGSLAAATILLDLNSAD
jgi:ABC-2 type transport system permease protein